MNAPSLEEAGVQRDEGIGVDVGVAAQMLLQTLGDRFEAPARLDDAHAWRSVRRAWTVAERNGR